MKKKTKKFIPPPPKTKAELAKERVVLKLRLINKREAIHNLKSNMDRLKRHVREDIQSANEKDRLTALIIRIMMKTSERVGNSSSAAAGHFGVTHFRNKHIKIDGNNVILDYVGKSGVEHEKEFSDEACANILKELKSRGKQWLFCTATGFRIRPDRINRYLKAYGAKSKDIRGFNSNRMMIKKLNCIAPVVEEKQRPKIFNITLRSIASKIGHGPGTLRKHYLLPEIEEYFYKTGKVINLNLD